MRIDIEIDEIDLKQLVLEHIIKQTGNSSITIEDINIETKSKQNYESEWERAAFRAKIVKAL